MQKDDFIKLANEGHSRVSVSKVIKNIAKQIVVKGK